MSILGLLVLIIIVDLVLWLANTYIPMAQPVRTILNVVVVLVLVLVILQAFGVLPFFDRPVPRLR